ncbi:uncharacterized protein [Elaeis guineensis]|uniref:uncharacterized protein isoform X1 n=1 Tax=Elaeis guineensis var. tenera TaxID=51953 RepID=UPI003C6CD608
MRPPALHWARKRSCCSFSFLTYLLPGPIAYAASSCSLRPPAPAWSSRTNSLATGNLSSCPSIPIGSPSSGSIGWIFINVLEGPILEQVLHQPALDRDALSGVRLNHGYWEHRQSMSCLPTATSVVIIRYVSSKFLVRTQITKTFVFRMLEGDLHLFSVSSYCK